MYGVTSYLLISTAITTLLEKANILLAYVTGPAKTGHVGTLFLPTFSFFLNP